MKPTCTTPKKPVNGASRSAAARVAALFLIIGLVAAALTLWFSRVHRGRQLTPSAPPPAQTEATVLSAATKSLLAGLTAPVELHLHSRVNLPGVPESLGAFAGRVKVLLQEFEKQGNGMIKLKAPDPLATAGAEQRAQAEGIELLPMGRGSLGWLGISISQSGRRIALPRLEMDWEPALEFDISRAIQQVQQDHIGESGSLSRSTTAPDASALHSLEEKIENLASVSFEEGARILREDAVAEFRKIALETQRLTSETQRRLEQATTSGSDADRQQALDELRALETQQAQRTREVARQLQRQLAALEHLKRSAPVSKVITAKPEP